MTTSTASLKAQFDLQTRLYNNALHGITDEEANSRDNEHINHMKWIAGHLLNTRLNSFSKMVGLAPDDTYAAQFGRGVSLDTNTPYPPLTEITSKWRETSDAIGQNLSNIPEETLGAVSPAKVPIADETIRGTLAFLISHEAYHIGQLGMLRKMIGKEAMSYN